MIVSERFWSKVNKDSGECWLWTGSVDSRGYGSFSLSNKTVRAHRVAYELVNGEIEGNSSYHGTVVRHTCDNKLCCNPAHLITGTQKNNCEDTKERNRRKGKCLGQSNGRAKLSIDQVIAIRADTRGKRTIAKDYFISPSQVQRIRNGLQWAVM